MKKFDRPCAVPLRARAESVQAGSMAAVRRGAAGDSITRAIPTNQAPAGARSGAAPTFGGLTMRQLVLILKGKPAVVVAALQALAARLEK